MQNADGCATIFLLEFIEECDLVLREYLKRNKKAIIDFAILLVILVVISFASLLLLRAFDVLRVLWKEIRVGLLCGAALSVVAFGKVMLVDRLIMGNPSVTLTVAVAVSLSLGVTVLAAKIVGCSLPLLAKRVGLDPAVMASPLITTLVDAVGLILYFFISAYAFGLTV